MFILRVFVLIFRNVDLVCHLIICFSKRIIGLFFTRLALFLSVWRRGELPFGRRFLFRHMLPYKTSPKWTWRRFFFGERERVGGAPTPSSPRPRPPPLLVHKGTLCASCTRMADTRGSTSSGGGDDRGREGHDDFTGGGQYNRYHRILEAVPSPLVRSENVVHHQYPTGLIHHPSSTMPVAPCSYVPRYTMVPTSAMLPLQHHHRQLQISQG